MSSIQSPIIVGVDGSTPSVEAIRWAAAEAALRHRPLRLVHAFTWPAVTTALAASGYGWTEETTREQAETTVAEAVEVARAEAPGVPVTGDAVSGPIAQTLIGMSGDAAMVVVGTRGHGGFAALLLGSVATAVAAHARSPVTVVRKPGAGTGIIVGVDGSPASDAALGFAFDEAERRGDALSVVHAWTPPPPPWRSGVLPGTHDLAELEAVEERAVRGWTRPWQDKHPSVTVQCRVTSERAAAALVDASVEAALVVVGSRGHGGFAGLLLGSVSQQVIHHAASPVTVIRG